MAIMVAKVTYSLKPETVDRVQELSTAWGVPKSEVIRRVVDEAAKKEIRLPTLTPLEALAELRKTAGISVKQAAAWNREVRLSRQASSRKRSAELAREWRLARKRIAVSTSKSDRKKL